MTPPARRPRAGAGPASGTGPTIRESGEAAEGPLWTDGEMMFRLSGSGAEPDRLIKVRRPFAVVGRGPDCDVAIADRAVSARHAYLHLDSRGVYVVDLVTRTGTRFNGKRQEVGWLLPGDSIEVAGRRVELVRIRLNGLTVEPPPCVADLLADRGQDGLTAMTLEPRPSNGPPWLLGSELVFLGWSASCGIPIKDPSVSRTHCAIVRAPAGAYLVDLCGRETWVEDRQVRGASVLHDGDLVTIGATRFTARVGPPARPVENANAPRFDDPQPRVGDQSPRSLEPPLSRDLATLSTTTARLSLDPALIPDEVQTALLAWMLGTIRGGQGEVLRRQDEYQHAMATILRQIQQDHTTLLNAHLSRIEGIDRELAALRIEIERRDPAQSSHSPPAAAPLMVRRPEPATHPDSTESNVPTHWLLNRVKQLEGDNQAAWKDLLGRLSRPRNSS